MCLPLHIDTYCFGRIKENQLLLRAGVISKSHLLL